MIPDKIHLTNIKKSHMLFKQGLKNITENAFMSNKRKQHFLNNYNNLWRSNNNKTNIYLFIPNNNINNWDKQLKILFWRVNFMRMLTNNKKSLDIWIYPSEYKKHVPKTKVITTDDINSGSTTTYFNTNDNGVICIWRKEEILKVLLHEIIHSFRLDEKDNIPVEAYTELKALYANIYLELLERQIPLTTKNINKLIEYEKIFGVEQSKKIEKCKNNNTNIHHYINEKSRLLHQMNKKDWNAYVKRTKIKKPFVDKKSLRFTITDNILKDKPRSLFKTGKYGIPFDKAQ